MRRRETISCLLTLVAAPAAYAQAPTPLRKIGYLHSRTISPNHSTLKILGKAWRQLGYVEGETVLLRSAEGDARRLPALVEDLIDLGVGALIVVGAPAIMVASQVTRTTPIVGIDLGIDPVRAGWAASRRRPRGNVTGLFLDQPSIVGKWIELLRDAAPDIQRIAFVSDTGTALDQLGVAKTLAKERGFDVVVLEAGKISSFDTALRILSGTPKTAVAQLSVSSFTLAEAADLAAAVQRYQLPTIACVRSWLIIGALMSYGPIVEAYFPRAVILADKILKGERPDETPIEGPDRFELVINLNIAKELGLQIPKSLLLRADEVIR